MYPPRTAGPTTVLPAQQSNLAASPAPLYLETYITSFFFFSTVRSQSLCEHHRYVLFREVLPLQYFFTSLIWMGLTAIRYLGSASKNRKRTNCHPSSMLKDVIFLLYLLFVVLADEYKQLFLPNSLTKGSPFSGS